MGEEDITLWEKFDSFVSEGRIIFVKEMKNEINRKHKSAPLVEWVKEHSNLFLPPTSEEAHFVADIFKVKHFQQLIKYKEYLAGHPVADPFIIAKAKIINGHVVINEEDTPNAGKIPNVCKHFSIPCYEYGDIYEKGKLGILRNGPTVVGRYSSKLQSLHSRPQTILA